MSKFVDEIESQRRIDANLRKEGQKNAMVSKERGHASFLNSYGIKAYYKEKINNPLTEEELKEIQNLLKIDINLNETLSFNNGMAKGKRLDSIGELEKAMPEIEEKIEEYIAFQKKLKTRR